MALALLLLGAGNNCAAPADGRGSLKNPDAPAVKRKAEEDWGK